MPPKSRAGRQGSGHTRWLSRLRQSTTAERVSVASAAVAAVAAVAIFIVTWAQWRVLSGQLEEMREASAQSAQLIGTNRRLAEAAATQAEASQRAATAAEGSAETARQSQLLSRRAWVGPYSVGLGTRIPKTGNPRS